VTDTIERRSSLSPSGPEGSAQSNDDFVILDDRRRLRMRWWTVLVLAVVAAAFLFLESTGAVPHAFSRHGPLLAFAVYLMVAFTFPPMPPYARKNPASHAYLATVAFWFFAGLAIQFRELFPEKAGLFQGIYLGLGGASLIAAVWLSRKPLQPAGEALQPALKTTGSGMSRRSKMHTRGQLFFSLIILAFLAWAQLVQDLAAARAVIPAAASDDRVEAWQVWERGWLQRYRPLLGPGLFTLAILLVGVPVMLRHPRLEEWEDVDWPAERLPPRYRKKRKSETGS